LAAIIGIVLLVVDVLEVGVFIVFIVGLVFRARRLAVRGARVAILIHEALAARLIGALVELAACGMAILEAVIVRIFVFFFVAVFVAVPVLFELVLLVLGIVVVRFLVELLLIGIL